MVSFTCNICGADNSVEDFASESASCACGSNVRLRALIHLLSMELFGQSLLLPDFPKLRPIRGLGMTDKKCYAEILANRFDYTNTYYDREPRLDFTETHPSMYGSYDFILSADVFEHIAPPIERALEEVHRLLKPCGFVVFTLYCNAIDRMREHFPDLHEYRLVRLGDSTVLLNRKRDGELEVREDLVFHAGVGATLEMREFGITDLKAKLFAAGFMDVHLLTENVPELGIVLDHQVSQPAIARREPYVMDLSARRQLIDLWRTAQWRETLLSKRIQLASESRWVQLGRKLGIGPNFGEDPRPPE